MNEFLIQLQAILDAETSKGNINKSLTRIQNNLNKLKVQAEIDPNALLKITKQLQRALSNPKINMSTIGIDSSSSIKQAEQIGQKIGQTISKSTENNINVDKLNADIKTLTNNLNNFSSKNEGFAKFKTEINGVEVSLDSLISKLSTVDNANDLATLRSQANALKTTFTELSQANKIQLSIDTGGYESKVESLIARTRQWTDENGNARISTTALSTALDNLNSASNNLANNNTVANQQALISAEKELKTQVDSVTNSVRSMNAELAKDSAISSLHNSIADFMSKNGKAVKYYGTELREIFTQTAQGSKLSNQELAKLKQQFIDLQNTARNFGRLGKTWFQTIREGMSSFSYWTSSTFLVMKVIQSVKGGLSGVRELDTSLVDLRKTTTMTAKEQEDFYYASNEVAKQMGVTTAEIINQASAWSRLGYSSAEAATKMAKYSSMFASISPGMSLDSATDGLVSIMKAYDIGNSNPDDVLDGIMSKINVIGNTAATSNAEIVNMLSKSSSAMAEANNTLEETIALETAAVEITRDDDSVGTAFKTISMRIRGKQTLPPYKEIYMLCA